MIKRCSKCKKPGEFYANKRWPDGLHPWCKACHKRYRSQPAVRQKNKERMQKHRLTPQGWAAYTWQSILSRAGNADGQHPAYALVEVQMTREEFIAWAKPRIAAWWKANPGVTPSVDRKKNAGHYELGNLRIISLSANSRLQATHKNVHAPRGKAWCAFCRDYFPRKNFYKNRNAPHGLQFCCKKCSGNQNRKSRMRKKTKCSTA
jgi:hypothetical protein